MQPAPAIRCRIRRAQREAARRLTSRNPLGKCSAKQDTSLAYHRRVAAERETDRTGAGLAECVTGRASDSICCKPIGQSRRVWHAKAFVCRLVELDPCV